LTSKKTTRIDLKSRRRRRRRRMTTEFVNFQQTILPDYIPNLLQAIKNIECVGRFEWRKDNGYAFLSVSNQFGFKSLLPGLFERGFRVRWTIRKRRTPAAHISVMVPDEYGSVEDSVLIALEEELRTKKISFRIEGVKVMQHQEKDSSRLFWLIAFIVKSEELGIIREKMGLKNREIFNSHMTVLEYEIIQK
jgi:hypothetical protein